MEIIVSDDIYLSPFTESDIPVLMQCLNLPEITENLLTLPFPYTADDALKFLKLNEKLFDKYQLHLNYAIRFRGNQKMIGSIGLELNNSKHQDHSGQIGYYCLPEHHGKGIMTKCLKTFTLWAFHTFKLKRISAPIFIHNIASERVAQKCGYLLEATLIKYYKKNGKYIDTKLYTIWNE